MKSEGFSIEHFSTLTSTNDHAMGYDYPHGTVIVAENQTAGRGQRGNLWQAQAGANLTFSLVVHPRHIPVCEQYTISMIAALAASDTLREWGVDCEIKWSNDIYVNDKKIGGILIEHSFHSENLAKSVIGVGLNINQTHFPPEIPNPTSMSLLCGGSYDKTPILDAFITCFRERYSQSNTRLHADYTQRLWRREGLWRFRDKEGDFVASIREVDNKTGQLTLLDERGELRRYWFKEVEFLL